MFIKLDIFGGKSKRMDAMVLRGNVDREILVSSTNLKQWHLIHPTIPVETVDQYISRYLKHEIKVVKDYNGVKTVNGQKVKSQKLRKQPKECRVLREKIRKKYADCFKETIGKEDRVRIKPIHLEIDKTRGIRPFH